MAKSPTTASKARTVASQGTDVRDRVKTLTLRAFRDRNLGLKDLSKVVHEVLDGASQGIEDAVPKSQKNVLRQVFNGLEEAVDVTAKEGMGAARGAKERGERVVKKNAPAAAKHMREANDQFLHAAGTFAKKLSGEMRDELQDLVARAKRAAPKVGSAARNAATAADGRLVELGGEAARAGSKVARRTIGGIMMATGGLFEGLAESINPKRTAAKPATTRRSTPKPKKRGRKKS